MKPWTLTIGTAMIVPASVRALISSRTRRMILTPAISSPCTAALSQMVGPSSRPWTTRSGIEMVLPVTSLASGRSPITSVPGATSRSPLWNDSGGVMRDPCSFGALPSLADRRDMTRLNRR